MIVPYPLFEVARCPLRSVIKTSPPAVVTPAETYEQRVQRGRQFHGPALAGFVYAAQTKELIDNDKVTSSAAAYASDMIARMKCRDPMEEMLAAQALWTQSTAGQTFGDGPDSNPSVFAEADPRGRRSRLEHLQEIDARTRRIPPPAAVGPVYRD